MNRPVGGGPGRPVRYETVDGGVAIGSCMTGSVSVGEVATLKDARENIAIVREATAKTGTPS